MESNPLMESPHNINGGEAPVNHENHVVPGSREQEILDEKKMKRILQGRQSARKYRLKKDIHAMNLQTHSKALKMEIEMKALRKNHVNHHNSSLRAENGMLEKKLSNYIAEESFKAARIEDLKNHLDQLNAYKQQRLQFNNQNMNFPFGPV